MTDQLGQITWYTIHEVEITRQEIIDKLKNAGLSTGFAPQPIITSDAFRRATREMETRRRPLNDATFVNLLVREVHTDAHEIVRHMVREVVDAKNRRLCFEQVAILKLLRPAGSFIVNELLLLTQAEQEAVNHATSRFERYRDTYQSSHIRKIVTTILRTLDHITLRPSGGVYFVPGEYADELQKLKVFLNTVGAEMWTMPVLDTGDTRAVIAHSLDVEVKETAERLVKHLADRLSKRGQITETEQRHAVEAFGRLKQMTLKYRALLEDKLLSSQSNLEVAMRQVTQILSA